LAATAREVPTWLVTDDAAKADHLKAAGVEVIELGADLSDTDFVLAAARALAARGLNRVMVEGGAAIAGAFLKADLIDQVAWFRAPAIIGGDGLSAVRALEATDLDRIARFKRRDTLTLGDDQVDFLDR
jgi:diaminohydroxyphosphoribosylaminopyrimidine deaminase/5-amino-6-(5-phosphoribosylamino)uracil reductase